MAFKAFEIVYWKLYNTTSMSIYWQEPWYDARAILLRLSFLKFTFENLLLFSLEKAMVLWIDLRLFEQPQGSIQS